MKKTSIITVISFIFLLSAGILFAKQASTSSASGSALVKDNPSEPAATGQAPVYYSLTVEGIIDIANSDYIVSNIVQAEKDNAAGVIINIQTPGGLDRSMRKICEKLLSSSVPVITYVTPKGSRAASAGVFILLASHIAAMAEGTNIGTAHPVDYSGNAVSEKITNDALAYIKNLARMRGRNVDWAADAVFKNVSSSELEALKLKVIDVTAKDIAELMAKIDNKEVKVNENIKKINTKNYVIKDMKPSQKHTFLHMLSDPNIVYVLFLIGIYGLIYELANAGSVVFPGILGAIALVLAFTGFESLPINVAGLILIGLSGLLFFIEMMNSTHGTLALGGVISMVLGSFLLFPSRAHGSAWAASWFLIAFMIILTVAFFVLVVGAVVKALKKKAVSGVESLAGKNGVAITEVKDTGVVNVGGEEWQAYSDEVIKERDIIEVLAVEGMKMKVKRVERKKE